MPTVLHRLARWAEETPHAPAQCYKSGSEWKSISAREFRDRVYHLALFLEARGVTPDQACAIFSYNNPQWVQMELAALLLGARSAGLYPNANQGEIHYVLDHSDASVLSVQNKDYFKRITGENGEERPPEKIGLVIVFDGDVSISPKAVSFETALAEGERLASEPGVRSYDAFLSKVDPKAGSFMIYTSGTTGRPKGALLSHDNLTYTADMVTRFWHLPYARGSLFSFLPLCHIAEKIQNVGVGISQRYAVNFCSKFENVSAELAEVQPSLLLCVPRLWEKMMEGVLNKVARGKGLKKRLAEWALGVGARVAEAKYSGRAPSTLDSLQLRIADKLVLHKVRKALGLGRAEMLASGAAALPAHVSRWFRSLGLEILEDFGQTESTGVICMTEPGVESAGTVGKPVPGVEFRIAEDGEILTRGRHVFVGYHKDPDATAKALNGEGWLHTGDLGRVDESGLVRILGRKKELLKTSGGKLVAPLPIEERLKAAPIISQVCMVGEGRKYLSAIVTLSEDTLSEVQARNGQATHDGVVVDDEIVSQVKRKIEEVNRDLAGFEQIKRFTVLSREFSIQEGEMTPTLKMKRNVIENHFRNLIDRMYA